MIVDKPGADLAAPERAGPDKDQPHAAVRCRAIVDTDLDGVVRVLGRGFPDRTEAYWRDGLSRLASLPRVGSAPRYGYLLVHGEEVVGVLLTIFAPPPRTEGEASRCNLSSWYVDPKYRGYGVLLDTVAMRDRRVTYTNISPAPHSVEMHEARGFVPFCGGQAVILPALSRRPRNQSVRRWTEDVDGGLTPHQADIMRHHVGFGCIALLCEEGRDRQPVLLMPRRLKLSQRKGVGSGLPSAQMIYGPSGPELERWAGTIGRFLVRHHGILLLLVDADGPIPGVAGRYFEGRKRKYARGPHRPGLGDLTYSELVIFGP